ncbi:MAG: DUF1285 domain-containing protein [Pseudomonadales bacterium]
MKSVVALDDLFASLQSTARHGLPPVEKWAPDRIGKIDIEIKADGNWWHEGEEIRRHELVKLFASILVREENGCYYLVTPVEKLEIRVQDAAFIVVESITTVEKLNEHGSGEEAVNVRTNTDDAITIGSKHPIELRSNIPYVYVRRGLWARVNRNVYYQWVESSLDANLKTDSELYLRSRGLDFSLGPLE